MSEVPNSDTLPEHAIGRWGVSACLRYLIHRKGGTWTAERAAAELLAIDWKTGSRYPLNMAGNMLNRLADCGALVCVKRGVYTVDHDVLEKILSQGIRAYAHAQREGQPVNQVVDIAPPS